MRALDRAPDRHQPRTSRCSRRCRRSSARILVVDDRRELVGAPAGVAGDSARAERDVVDPRTALALMNEREFDLLIVSLSLADADALRLCSQTRSLDRTRHLPIIVLVEPGDEAAPAARARHGRQRLHHAPDRQERADGARQNAGEAQALFRPSAQPSRGKHRSGDDRSADGAATTGATSNAISRDARGRGDPLGALALGAARRHRPLQERERHARPRRRRRRPEGVLCPLPPQHALASICRAAYGGEEFLVIMPDTNMSRAYQVGERLRVAIAADPFACAPGCGGIHLTASVGIATLESAPTTHRRRFFAAPTTRYLPPSGAGAIALRPTRPERQRAER